MEDRAKMSILTEPGKLAAGDGRKDSRDMYSVLEYFTVPPLVLVWTKVVLQLPLMRQSDTVFVLGKMHMLWHSYS